MLFNFLKKTKSEYNAAPINAGPILYNVGDCFCLKHGFGENEIPIGIEKVSVNGILKIERIEEGNPAHSCLPYSLGKGYWVGNYFIEKYMEKI